jgi:hypothetical protein
MNEKENKLNKSYYIIRKEEKVGILSDLTKFVRKGSGWWRQYKKRIEP